MPSHRFCVAPMMDWTDSRCRTFHRQLTRRALLYTEMLTSWALLNGDSQRLLKYASAEHPLALQLGGCEPAALAQCARMAEDAGYAEVNLNVGCPSDRVQAARFGACLMAEPLLVADCVAAMRAAVRIPVTVKCRIGIDDQDDDAGLSHFVQQVQSAGCATFIVHARKAWLKGLSPKENREIPPLRYERVYRLKQEFPQLEIILNGGIQSLDEAEHHLQHVDGVMMGRAAYQTPWVLADVDRRLFGATNPLSNREDAVHAMLPFIVSEMAAGVPLRSITRHMLGLWQGMPGARSWRRTLSESRKDALETVHAALACVRAEPLAA